MPGARPVRVPEAMTRDCRMSGLSGPCCRSLSAHNAVMPATCGVAMLVPLIVRVPPPGQADVTFTPGPATVARVFEKGAIVSPDVPWLRAPTATIPVAAAGGPH